MTTEEDLLQEQYMGNRLSRQLHLGYPREYQEEYHEYHEASRRRKMTRALSVRCPLFTSSDASISLVEVRKKRPARTQAVEKDDPEMTKSPTSYDVQLEGMRPLLSHLSQSSL